MQQESAMARQTFFALMDSFGHPGEALNVRDGIKPLETFDKKSPRYYRAIIDLATLP